jgi:hypothetical protein
MYKSPLRGTACLYVSPDGFSELIKRGDIKPRDKNIRVAPQDWLSGTGIKESGKYVGNSEKNDEKIKDFAKRKLKQLIAGGMSKEAAEIELQSKWIGNYTKSGTSAFYISPKALAELVEENIIVPRTQMAPLAPEGWQSGAMLARSKQYVGGNTVQTSNLSEFREQKIAELTDTGLSKKEADKQISEQWVGTYTKMGKETLYASPKAVKELLRIGKIKLASQKAPPAPDGWITGSVIGNDERFAGHTLKYNDKIKEYAGIKLTELAKKLPASKAQETLKCDWVAEYTNKSGYECTHISPRAFEEMIERGMIDFKDKKSSEHLKTKPITSRKSPAHMTDEERDKAKRGGRGKG